jgi:hypothetical protein
VYLKKIHTLVAQRGAPPPGESVIYFSAVGPARRSVRGVFSLEFYLVYHWSKDFAWVINRSFFLLRAGVLLETQYVFK